MRWTRTKGGKNLQTNRRPKRMDRPLGRLHAMANQTSVLLIAESESESGESAQSPA